MLVGRTLGLQLLTAGVTVALARILTPADYGLFAIALAVQLVGLRAAELGLPAALVRMEEEPSPRLQSAVGGILLVASALLAGLLLLAAFGLMPVLGGGSRGIEVVAVAAGAIPFYAARAVPMALMERGLRFGRVAIVETADTLAFNAFALAAALAGLGVFSLAGAVPAGGLAGAVAAWALQRFAWRPRLELAPVRPLIGFGLRVTALQGVYLMRDLGFVAIVASVGGTAAAGFYAMAKRLFSFPVALSSAVARVAFPALSREPELRSRRAAGAVAYTAIAAGLPLALVAGAIEPLIEVVLGDRWRPTVDVVLVGSLGMMLMASANPAMVGLALAEGRPRYPLVSAIAETVVACAAAALLTATLGEAGVGLALTVSAVVAAIALAAGTDFLVRRSLLTVAKASAIAAAAAAAGYLLGDDADLSALVASLAAVTAVWLTLQMIFFRGEMTRIAALVLPRLRRGGAPA